MFHAVDPVGLVKPVSKDRFVLTAMVYLCCSTVMIQTSIHVTYDCYEWILVVSVSAFSLYTTFPVSRRVPLWLHALPTNSSVATESSQWNSSQDLLLFSRLPCAPETWLQG